MTFVDTNYFLRFLLQDVESQHRIAKSLFLEGAKGKVKLFTSIIVFFEVYWVLSSFYRKKKPRLVGVLGKILKMEFVELESRHLLKEAVGLFERIRLDLEDVFNLVYARKREAKEFKTFDQKLLREYGRIRG